MPCLTADCYTVCSMKKLRFLFSDKLLVSTNIPEPMTELKMADGL